MSSLKSIIRVVVGTTYRHYKGSHYLVTGIGRHTETEEDMVIYHAIEKPKQIWIRPLSMFINKQKFADKSEVQRFTEIE